MIASFMTKFADGKKTRFLEKIIKSLESVDSSQVEESFLVLNTSEYSPKIHTMRKGNRWRPGLPIHFYLHARTPKAVQFAKSMCLSVQSVFMRYQSNLEYLEVWIDGKKLDHYNINLLIKNDGLTFNRFTDFFFPGSSIIQEWEGQLIHWTKLKYPISAKIPPTGQYVAVKAIPEDQLNNMPQIEKSIVNGSECLNYENYSMWYDEWIGHQKINNLH